MMVRKTALIKLQKSNSTMRSARSWKPILDPQYIDRGCQLYAWPIKKIQA